MTPADDVDDLPAIVSGDAQAPDGLFEAVMSGELTLPQAVSSLERRVISEALRRADGNKSSAAAMVGITRRMLRYKLDVKQTDSGDETES